MENPKSLLSLTDLPEKWKPRYVIKRIDEVPIPISLEARNAILAELQKGSKFILIKDHVLMLNSVKSIDPVWENNIPPRPKLMWEFGDSKVYHQMDDLPAINQAELDEWEKYFGSHE